MHVVVVVDRAVAWNTEAEKPVKVSVGQFDWWLLLWVLLPLEMGSKTVIQIGYPAQIMLPDGSRSLVVNTTGLHWHSSMFWVFFGLLPE